MKRWILAAAAGCLSFAILGLSVSQAKPPVAQKKVAKPPENFQAAAAFRDEAQKMSGRKELDKIVALENKERGVTAEAMPVVDDLTFLRRIYCDLIGRIPSQDELVVFEKETSPVKRDELVDQLLQDDRFVHDFLE